MATPKNKNQKSPLPKIGKPGLHIFYKEESNQYYFQYNDQNGQALLFSQGYSTEKGCERGFATAVKNFNTPERIQKENGLNGNYFVIINGNKQKMAQSPSFDTVAEMEQTLDYLTQSFKGSKKGPEAKKEEPKKEALKEQRKKPLKYSFRVDFYQAGDSTELRGKIEYPLTREKTSFEGLDKDAITKFISKFLPEIYQAPSDEKQQSIKKEERDIAVFKEGDQKDNNYLTQKDKLEVRMVSNNLSVPHQYDAAVFVRSMDTGNVYLVGKKRGSTNGNNTIRVPFELLSLNTGFYRLITKVNLSEPQAPKKELELEGSKLVHVF